MSTRIYPVFKEGSKQLRVFLPDFWMMLIKPTHNLLPNQVQFIVSPQMTKLDVKQYLEKIYNVPVVNVSTHIHMGKTKRAPGQHYIIKEDDSKFAYVTLEKGHNFTFPDLFPQSAEVKDKNDKAIDEVKTNFLKRTTVNAHNQGVPSWFSH